MTQVSSCSWKNHTSKKCFRQPLSARGELRFPIAASFQPPVSILLSALVGNRYERRVVLPEPSRGRLPAVDSRQGTAQAGDIGLSGEAHR